MAMLKGVHQMIKDLRPPILDDLGLESAIKWVLEKHIGSGGSDTDSRRRGAARS